MYYRKKPAYRKKKPRRTYRKKRYGYRSRRSARFALTRTMPRSEPVPDRLFVKLRYADIVTHTTSAIANTMTVVLTYQSSLFDPNYATGGHQPMWFDQWANMYSSYRVYGIGYTITANVENKNETCIFGVRHLNNPAVLDTTIVTWMERRDAKVRVLGSVNANNKGTIKGYMSVAKTRGISKYTIRSDNNFEATFTSNPALMGYIGIYDQATAASALITYSVQLTYYAELFDKVTPPVS